MNTESEKSAGATGNNTTGMPQQTEVTHHPCVIPAFVLGVASVVTLVVAARMTAAYLYIDRTQWLIVGALPLAVCSCICGATVIRAKAAGDGNRSGKAVAWFSSLMAVACLIAVLPVYQLRRGRLKSATRVCIANLQSINDAISRGMKLDSNVVGTIKNSMEFDPDFLKDSRIISCPLSPGVPYPCHPTRTNAPSVECPNSRIAPEHRL